MALKSYKPRSQGMRFRVSPTFEEITEKRPVKRLTKAVRKTAGRDNQGHISTRHHGGGVKQRMRIVDFKRVKQGFESTVKEIAYDPTRSGIWTSGRQLPTVASALGPFMTFMPTLRPSGARM